MGQRAGCDIRSSGGDGRGVCALMGGGMANHWSGHPAPGGSTQTRFPGKKRGEREGRGEERRRESLS